MRTTCIGAATVVCTGIAIIAIGGYSATTLSFLAGFANGAAIAVIASQPFMCRDYFAFAAIGNTNGGKTEGVRPSRCVAIHHTTGVYLALVGQLVLVTNKVTGTGATVIEWSAIDVLYAIAGHCKPNADVLFAAIRNGARVTVIATSEVSRVLAPAQPVTCIVCTGIVVVAIDGSANANPRIAVVANSTGIPIEAFPLRECRVAAAVGPQAGIVSAGVFVVA